MSPSSMQQQVESQLLASYESLYRLAYTYVKNPDDAMDVVQESAFKAISRSADVRSPAAIRGWLCRIVVNTAMDGWPARWTTPMSGSCATTTTCGSRGTPPLSCWTEGESC